MKVGHPENAGLFTSGEGLRFIESWEAFRPKRYKDDAGVWTIGIGTTGGKAEIEGYVMTYEEATRLFRAHVRQDEATVKRLVKVPLTQGQFDALVAWQYNTGALAGSTLIKVLNSGNYSGAVEQMRRWDKITDPKTKKKKVSKGLVNRREAEAVMFRMGTVVTRPEKLEPGSTNVVAENNDKPILATKTSIGTIVGGGAGAASSVAAIAELSEVGQDVSDNATNLAMFAESGSTFYAVMLTLIVVGTLLALYGRWHIRRKAGG